jgi:hypothetical protein
MAIQVNGTTVIDDSRNISNLNTLTPPTGTASSGSEGNVRYNNSLKTLEVYNGSSWLGIPTLPTVTDISPSSGANVTTFTITGTNFTAGSTVTFLPTSGSSVTASSVTVNSSTTITATLSSALSSAGSPWSVQVTTNAGSATGGSYTEISIILANGDLFSPSGNFISFAGWNAEVVTVTSSYPGITPYTALVVDMTGSGDYYVVTQYTSGTKSSSGWNYPFNPYDTNTPISTSMSNDTVGQFSGFFDYKQPSKVAIASSSGQWQSFTLNNAISNNYSLRDRIVYIGNSNYVVTTSNNPNLGLTQGYGGVANTDGNTTFYDNIGPVQYFHLYGENTSSDTDESVMAFTSQPSNANTWSDSWRGIAQTGTFWSLWNDDYGASNNPGTRFNSSMGGQGGPGTPTLIAAKPVLVLCK